MAILTDIQLLKRRRTKIVATVGPASSTTERIEALIAAGVNVFRLNMSHGTHEDHAGNVVRIRDRAAQARRPVAILADLCGPKIRVGEFADGGIDIQAGEEVTITTRDVLGEQGLIPTGYGQLADDVEPGSRVLINDGLMELSVLDVDGTEVRCRVVQGGQIGRAHV